MLGIWCMSKTDGSMRFIVFEIWRIQSMYLCVQMLNPINARMPCENVTEEKKRQQQMISYLKANWTPTSIIDSRRRKKIKTVDRM